ncbi:MAG: phytanoyl-CoA dioxygenase family protein [Gammaproteobacteria bacterium]|nr:phytanoyl-CoA dioxygenase family protein [Gammaproteobacteria bacterium]
MTSLTQVQQDQYWDDGFLFPLQVLPAADAHSYRQQLEAIEAAKEFDDLPRKTTEYLRSHAEIVIPMAAELALNEKVLDCVEGVIGPNLLIWGADFFIKDAGSDHIVTMHQDLTYWGFGETSDQVTAWIALSPATVESGCMNLVRGSHKNPILPHQDTYADDNLLSRGQEVVVKVAEQDKVPVELQPGEMSLHHGQVIHGSDVNRSSDRRIGFAIRYVNPAAGKRMPGRYHAMLARGENVDGNFNLFEKPASLWNKRSLDTYEAVRANFDAILSEGMEGDRSLFS